MINNASQGTVYFEIGELKSELNKGFAGYTGYNKSSEPGFEKQIEKFLKNASGNDPTKRPTRIKKPGGKHDSSLSIIAEPGTNRYTVVLAQESRAAFDAKAEPIISIPSIGASPQSFITDIQRTKIGGRDVGSFLFDTIAAENSDLAMTVRKSGHGSALKIPFYLNLVDTLLGIPLWSTDDFRYDPDHQHVVPDSTDESNARITTHGGIHPPEVVSFVIVEL